MTPRTLSARTLAAFLGVAAVGVLLRPLTPIDETRYLAVAWEMWLRGDYLVPTRNFEIYTHKPPLLFWLINLVWSVTGVSETAARLVGPVAATVAVWLTGRLAENLWPDDGWIAARARLALAGMLMFAVSGGLTAFDALQALTVAGGMAALVAAVRGGRRRWWAAVGVAIGAGVLAKGPVMLVHMLPAMLAVPFWAGPFRTGTVHPSARVLGGRIALSLAVALAVVAVWLVPAIAAGGPAYRDAILWTQSAGRMAQSFAHARPWWFFLAALPLLLFPWVLVPSIWRAARRAAWSEPGLRLAAVWGLSGLLFFSVISGKQLHYLVPELPAAALVVARLTRDARFRPVLPALPVFLLAALAIAAATGVIPTGQLGRLLQPGSALLAWGLLLVALCWSALRTGGLAGTAALTLGTVLSANLLIGLTRTATVYDTHPVAGLLAPYEPQGIAAYGQTYHAEFNFAGRLAAPVANPMSPGELARWIAAHPGGVVLSRPDRTPLPWKPRATVLFRNAPYAVWHVEDAPRPLAPALSEPVS